MINIFLQCIFWIGLIAAIACALRFIVPKKNDRRRCHRCRYDMSGIPGSQCPECGRSAASERRLLYAPRRKAQGMLFAALVLMSYSGVAGQHAIVGGWTAAIPSTLLIAAYPVIESTSSGPKTTAASLIQIVSVLPGPGWNGPSKGTIADQLWSELSNRARKDNTRLARWQRSWLTEQAIARGSQSDGMIQALGGWEAMDDQQRDEYLRTTVPGMIKARDITALHEQMFIEVSQPGILANFETEITPAIRGCQPAHRTTRADFESTPVLLQAGAPEAEASGYAIDILIRHRDSDYTWNGRVETQARVHGDLDRLLPLNISDRFDEWMSANAEPTLHLSRIGGCIPPDMLSLELSMIVPRQQGSHASSNPAPAETEGMVLDAAVDLIAGGQHIGETRIRLVREPLSQGGAWRQIDRRRIPVRVKVDRFWTAVESGHQIQVRLKPSEPSLALSAFDGTSRWSGDITMPLDQLIAYDHARSIGSNWNQPVDPLTLQETRFWSEHRLDEPVASTE